MANKEGSIGAQKPDKSIREQLAIYGGLNRICAGIGGVVAATGFVALAYGAVQYKPLGEQLAQEQAYCSYGFTDDCEQAAQIHPDAEAALKLATNGGKLVLLGATSIAFGYTRSRRLYDHALQRIPLEEQVTLLAYEGGVPQDADVWAEPPLRRQTTKE